MNGVIYFILTTQGQVKIGRTTSFRSRFNGHKRQYGKDMKLLLLLPADNPVMSEREYHLMFKRFHIKNELFSVEMLQSIEYKGIYNMDGLISEYKFRLKRIWPDYELLG